jgi:hypothetical protein
MSHVSGAASQASVTDAGTRAISAAPRKHSRPNPLPSRLVMGIGALAALSVMAAGMGRLPAATLADPAGSTTTEPVSAQLAGDGAASRARVERPVRYVRLKPGERAPRGARVIREQAPAPRVVVRWVRTPSSPTAPSRAPVARTRQSGG